MKPIDGNSSLEIIVPIVALLLFQSEYWCLSEFFCETGRLGVRCLLCRVLERRPHHLRDAEVNRRHLASVCARCGIFGGFAARWSLRKI